MAPLAGSAALPMNFSTNRIQPPKKCCAAEDGSERWHELGHVSPVAQRQILEQGQTKWLTVKGIQLPGLDIDDRRSSGRVV
jgi:hypothetical protein